MLQGDTVVLTALEPVWLVTCEDHPRVVQREADAWTLLRDDRPVGFNLQHSAHYLDGSYQSDCQPSLGCDIVRCDRFPDTQEEAEEYHGRLIALEYVQTGQRGAPTCDAPGAPDAGVEADASTDAGSRVVPDVETRAPRAPLGVRVRYFVDGCQTEPITADVPVE